MALDTVVQRQVIYKQDLGKMRLKGRGMRGENPGEGGSMVAGRDGRAALDYFLRSILVALS